MPSGIVVPDEHDLPCGESLVSGWGFEQPGEEGEDHLEQFPVGPVQQGGE